MATTDSGVSGTTNLGTYKEPIAGKQISQESSLSNWAGPYVTDMLGKGQALANQPYQAYTGPLTAGPSQLQTQAFQGISNLVAPSTMGGFTPQSFASPMGGQPPATPFLSRPSAMAPTSPITSQSPGLSQLIGERPANATDQDWERYTNAVIEQRQKRLDGDAGRYVGTGEGPDGFLQFMATPKGYRNVEAPGQPEVMAPGIADSMGIGSQPMLLPPPPGQPMGQPMGQPSGIASAYMNPYLREALDPQLKELQRQQAIRRVDNAGRLTKAGAYGGGRQAIMESELDRAYLDKAADVTGRGYAAAFDKGREQFNREQDLGLRAQDLTNRYGLDALRQQLLAGSTQQDITAEGIAADKKQFEEERDFPYKQLQYQKSLLQGMPLAAQNYGYADSSNLMKILAGASALTGKNSPFGGTSGGGISNVLSGATNYFKNFLQGQNPNMSETEFENYWDETEGGLFDEVGMTPEEWYGPGGGFMADGDVPYSEYFPLFEEDNDYSSYF